LKPARVLIFLIAFAAIGLAQQSGITPESLRTWLTYIASDDLEGRATFSEGLGLAAAYIAEQLKSAGVKPGGDHGTYFQRVEVLSVKSTNRSTVTVEVNGQTRTFKNGEGVRFESNVGVKRTVSFEKVQFVGYGLNLDAEHNDYKGIDVKGKVVLWLGGRGPKDTASQANRLLRARADYATQEMGAGATITPPADPLGGFRGARGGGAPAAAAPPAGRGGPVQPDFTTTQTLNHEIPPNIAVTDEFLDFLFSGSDQKYADLKAAAQMQEDLPRFELKGVKLTFDLDADYQVLNTRYTRNVVGIVEGTDARLKDSYVAFGAHYDHVGYTQGPLPAGQTDRINNGADDDGSGTVTLIGLARAFATGPKTKRSEIFVWHAGEELGLYGSEYFADHPEVPIDRIVAQLNIDMVGRNRDNLESESNTVYAVGADRISTELHNVLVDVNSALPKPMTLNFQLNDPTDAERIYYRSDHYSYAAKGIPIIFFTTFLHPDYHRPSDEVDKINFDKMARIANLVYEMGRRLANLDHAPARDFKGPRVGKGGQGKIVTSN
jgi:Peptidase family M28